MTTTYLLRDLHHNYLNKEGLWEAQKAENLHKSAVYHTFWKDEAINQKVEYIVKNPELRIEIEEVSVDAKGKLIFESEEETHA